MALVRGPFIQSLSKTNATIIWYTDTSNEDSIVLLGTTTNFTNRYQNSTISNTVATSKNSSSSSTVRTDSGKYKHSIRISGLEPNTKYYYAVGSTQAGILSSGSTTNFFYTSPETDNEQDMRFWVVADMGVGTSNQKAVKDRFITFNGSNKVDTWLWIGDNTYTYGYFSEYDSTIFTGTNTYQTELKKFPVFSVLGNHDYGTSSSGGYLSSTAQQNLKEYFTIFNSPSTSQCGGVASFSPKYYSLDWGNVHIVAMDGYNYLNPGSEQYNWLLNDLENNTKKWTILFQHFPAFSHGTHDSDTASECIAFRQNIAPIIYQNNIDLVLHGHSHVYERTYFMYNFTGLSADWSSSYITQPTSPYNKTLSAGTIFIVVGNGGQGGPVSTSGTWPHNAMASYDRSTWASLVIDITGTTTQTMTVRTINSSGTIIDSFQIIK
jgi:hypothetical protein